MQIKKYFGITLVELLVVMSIMSIIALASFPTYQTHLRESRRQDAIIGIRNMQLAVDSFINKNSTMPTASNFPAQDSPEGLYTISYSQQSSEIYQIQATAKAGNTQTNDTAKTASGATVNCATISITNQLDTTYPYECK